jgi:hypothetical protein
MIDDDDLDDDAKLSMAITGKIKPLLAGHPARVQSAVLAQLLAMWLAGHVALRQGTTENEKLRDDLLRDHIDLVRRLVPFDMRRMGTDKLQ